jgi:DNA topoisomerase-3
MTQAKLLESVTQVVSHDLPIMVENASRLDAVLGAPKPKVVRHKKTTEKVTGQWQGEEVSFSREWSGHVFSDDEIQTLLGGGQISFPAKTKRGKDYTATGKLAWQTFKGSRFMGFKLNPKPRKPKAGN